MTVCRCNHYEYVGTGFIKISGGSEVGQSPIGGGPKIGGGSWVLSNECGDGHSAIWPLVEDAGGWTNEYIDVTGRSMDGTGGGGDPECCFVRDLDEGVFCQPSQRGDYTNARQFIACPADEIADDQAFAVSMWIRFPGSLPPNFDHAQDPIFSRGTAFIVTTSVLGHITATVNTEDASFSAYTTISRFTPTKLEQNRWYHLAVSFKPLDGIRIYLDGVLNRFTPTPIEALAGAGPDLIGRVSDGKGYYGWLQDVRLHPSERSADWFLAEHDNYCGPGDFFVISDEEVEE